MSAITIDEAPARRPNRILGALTSKAFWSRNAVYFGLLAVWIAFFILTPDFLTYPNIQDVLVSAAVATILAVGQTFVVVAGGIDLTVGANVQFSGIFFGYIVVTGGLSLGLAIPLAILVGLAIGALVGLLISVLRINDFIVTLGGLSILTGAGLIVSGGQPVSVQSTWLLELATGSLGPIKYFILIAITVIVVGHVLMFNTRVGGQLRAAGGNELAAREAGISTSNMRIIAYAISGCCAAIGAVLLVARTGAADPNVGVSILLASIAAVVLGGASLKGGKGSIIGAAAGALLLTSLLNGFTLLQVSPFYQPIAVGAVVIASAILNRFDKK